jgi:hypothetical protein
MLSILSSDCSCSCSSRAEWIDSVPSALKKRKKPTDFRIFDVSGFRGTDSKTISIIFIIITHHHHRLFDYLATLSNYYPIEYIFA